MSYFERKEEILALLKANKTASVEELATKLYVSPATVRRDLTEMQKLGLVERSHGGAVIVEGSDEISILIRKAKNSREKNIAVTTMLRHIPEFSTVFIDNSSTCLALVERMSFAHKTVVTNGLHIALRLSQQDDVTLIVPGGVIHSNTSAVLGAMTTNTLNDFRFDLALLSCASVDDGGTWELSLETMELKKKALARSRQRYLVFDSTKLGAPATYRTAELKDYDLIATDADDGTLDTLRSRGANIVNR